MNEQQLELTLDRIPSFLLEEGLVSTDALVMDPGLDVQDRSSRNSNFVVSMSGPGSILIKQAKTEESRRTLHVEASILKAIRDDHRMRPLSPVTAGLVRYDASRGVLVTELVKPATSVRKLHLNLGEPHFPLSVARKAAENLALAHACLGRLHQAGLLSYMRHRAEFCFRWEEAGLGSWDDLSSTRRELVTRLQDSGILALRDEAWETLRRIGMPAHHDPRWDNFLVTEAGDDEEQFGLKMIDWETACIGDPAYDVAFYVGEHFRFFLNTHTTVVEDGRTERRALFDLALTRPAIAEFTARYLQAAEVSEEDVAAFRGRMRLYMPFVLATQAFEMAQGAKAVPRPSADAMAMAGRLADPAAPEWDEVFALGVGS